MSPSAGRCYRCRYVYPWAALTRDGAGWRCTDENRCARNRATRARFERQAKETA